METAAAQRKVNMMETLFIVIALGCTDQKRQMMSAQERRKIDANTSQ
jgi:hypothetical protein